MLAVSRHVEEHRHFWRALRQKGGAEVVLRILRDEISERTRRRLEKRFGGPGHDRLELDAAQRFVAGGCVALVAWYCTDEQLTESAQQIHARFRRLATKRLTPFLAPVDDRR